MENAMESLFKNLIKPAQILIRGTSSEENEKVLTEVVKNRVDWTLIKAEKKKTFIDMLQGK